MTKMYALRPMRASMPLMLFFALHFTNLVAQTCGPDCRALNLSITSLAQNEYHSKVRWTELIPNFGCAAPVSYELQTISGATVARGSSDDVGNEVYIVIDDPCRYLREGLMIVVSNKLGSCMNLLTFKKGMLNFEGRHYDISCLDPRVAGPAMEDYPAPVFACDGTVQPTFVADWPVIYDCVIGIQDTAKVIYREWEAFDKEGYRYTSFDTFVVFRLPQLDAGHLFCPDKDTLYCGISDRFGPYWLIESSLIAGTCDTISFIDVHNQAGQLSFSALNILQDCGLQIHLDTTKFASGCEEVWKFDLEIKQECAGGPNMANCSVPMGSQPQQLDDAGTYWRCTFWANNIDTLPPVIKCDYSHYGDQSILWPSTDMVVGPLTHCYDTPSSPSDDTVIPVVMVSTNAHDCSAIAAIPGLCIQDDWSGIGQVKASIEGIGTYVLNKVDTCSDGSDRYEADQAIELPLLEIPYRVIYEVSDACYNVDTVYCYILVKDGAKPVAVSDKGVTVSLSGKTAWVDAYEFDEGSYDNCAINLLLARRSDWSTAGVDLCDDLDSICDYHGEILMSPNLEINPEINEIEAHYAKTLKWFREDESPCSGVLLNAWQFGLIEEAYHNCGDGHLTQDDLLDIFQNSCRLNLDGTTESFGCGPQSNYETLLKSAALIGGGWSQEVPFTCEDACQSVTVEILVMDYWCNWSVNWTQVKVEERSPVRVLQEVEENIEITCNTFKIDRYAWNEELINLETATQLAETGDEQALSLLDEVFGGYEKVWVDANGHWVDIDGVQVPTEVTFHDSICYCQEVRKEIAVYDDHLGMMWVDSVYSECGYKDDVKKFKRGIVGVNCAQNVQCRQTVWTDLDHCGEGYIYRKFEIWSGCGVDDVNHPTDTIYRIQKIYVGNNCELTKAMFDIPGDVVIHSCGIEYDPLGSGQVTGAADPELTGYPVYRFDDDCRIIGVAHEDKVFKVVGGDEACYKIIRTWYFADWCQYGGEAEEGWWHDHTIIKDTCVQNIIVIDTVPPVCLITAPVEDGGIIDAAGCAYDFFAELDVMDECGIIDYTYQIYLGQEVVANGFGQLTAEIQDHVTISAASLSDGSYLLRVRTTDQCQNEGFCDYSFTIEAGKKPSPVCITSLTVELNPDDLDNDGEIDTATAIIWANEFDVSSSAPCGVPDSELKFYIERINADTDFETLDTTVDKDFLELGCQDIGTQNVRMWVLSPTGSVDFCDVYLKVQSNSGGCPQISPVFSNVEGIVSTTDQQGVKDVIIQGSINDMLVENPLTDQDGSYAMLFGLGEKVSIVPTKDGNDMNGVTTADLLALANHISNASPITDPYIRIAGDVNYDGVINAFDILVLRDLVLRNISEFPNGDSWRFVSKDYDFVTSSPENEMFPEQMDLLLDQENMQADFIGMKIGDLNLDRNTQGAGRSKDALIMQVEDQLVEVGEQYILTPSFDADVSLVGLQFELHFDAKKLQFDQVIFNGLMPLGEENLGLKFTQEGIIYCSWNGSNSLAIEKDQALFSLAFTGVEAARVSDAISLVGERLDAEVYMDTKNDKPIALNFSGAESVVEVAQNIPNPFREQTSIAVTLDQSQMINLVVNDLNGRVIFHKKVEGIAGKQNIEIRRENLNAPGVYYYSIITSKATVTKKMILLR